MTAEQGGVLAILMAAFGLCVWGRFRHDVVAFSALIVSVLAGLVPAREAFEGFGHPATVTVALVLILGRAMTGSGATDWISRLVRPFTATTGTHVGVLSGLGAAMSLFMNNVGALGLLMPVAMQSAASVKRNPSRVLMPLSFGAILGGLVTLVGTPPNVIVATYRGDALGAPFGMFDFTPVGGVVMVAGLAFVALLGWRLVPERRAARDAAETFELEKYLAEARVPGTDAEAYGMTIGELEEAARRFDAVVVGVVRRDERIAPSRRSLQLQTRDVILVEVDPEGLDAMMDALDLRPVGERSRGKARSRLLQSEDTALMEAVVEPDSRAAGRTLSQIDLRRRFGVTALGVSRQGRAQPMRLKKARLRVGDVLLLHGEKERLAEAMHEMDLLPLRERGHTFGRRTGAPWIIGIFAAAVATASLGYLSITVALIVLLGLMPLNEVYDAVDWPVIVLLGALIPIGGALESTGATGLLADGLAGLTAGLPAAAVLALLMVITMSLSDILNNAATAVVMAPIAVELARIMGVDPNALLMSVAIGASCAFLTPIGHQNNALVFGPGGYRFGDYWRMGLPLELLIVAVATPMLLLIWPL